MVPPKSKKAQQTMSLADFTKSFQAEGGQGTAPGGTVWADEELELPSAPLGLERAPERDRPGRYPMARGRGREEAPLPVVIDQRALPREPPFMAFVGNLSYDATEEDIKAFFSSMAIKGVRFPKGETGSRGFCYVEFHSVEGLTEALLKSGKSIKGRPCKVDLATAKRDDRDSGKLAAGNWRDGHQVVERPVSSFTKSRSSDFEGPTTAASNWRDTAKAIDAAPVRESSSLATAQRPLSATTMMRKKPDLKLTPRSKPITTTEDGEEALADEYKKSKKPNPFGDAKPREITLAEKKDTTVPEK